MPKKRYFLNSSDGYKVYKKSVKRPLDKKDFVLVINEYFQFISKKLVDTGHIVLPERLGKVEIVGRKSKVTFEEGKIKGLAPDWKATKELWEEDPEAKKNKQLVYHFNENTGGIRYRYNWYKTRVIANNKYYYNLVMTRNNKKALNKKIMEGKEYLIVK